MPSPKYRADSSRIDPMRIAVFAPEAGTKDGIAAYTGRLVAEWERAGHSVLWLYPARGTHVAAMPTGGSRKALSRRRRSLAKTVSSFQPDLAIVQFAVPAVRESLMSLILTGRSLKRTGVPVLMCCHEASRELALLGPACRLLYRLLRWCSTGFVAFSELEANLMVNAGLAPDVTSVPLGIVRMTHDASEIERVKQLYGIRSPSVLMTGWITRSKGTDLVLSAALEVAQRVGAVQFIVAGEPRPRKGFFRVFGQTDKRYAEDLRREVTASPRSVEISLPGYIPSLDLGPLMQAATVLVLPYRSVTQSATAAAALGSGTPIVASDLPGMTAQLGQAARYFRTDDHRDLALALSEVIGDAALRSKLVEVSQSRIEAESFERVARDLIAAGTKPQLGSSSET